MRTLSLALALTSGLVGNAAAQKGKPLDPKDVPLALELKSAKDSYKLDLGGKTAKEFLADIAANAKAGKALPKPPHVQLEVTVKNTGKEKIDFWIAGDPTRLNIRLMGPGAKSIAPPLASTLEFRLPKFLTLEPGKSHSFNINALMSGHRGMSDWHYWTQEGEYTLFVDFHTGIRPIPKGATEMHGGAPVVLTSNSVKVKIEK